MSLSVYIGFLAALCQAHNMVLGVKLVCCICETQHQANQKEINKCLPDIVTRRNVEHTYVQLLPAVGHLYCKSSPLVFVAVIANYIVCIF